MRDVAPQTKRSRLASRLSTGRLTPLLLAAGTILAGCGSGAPGQGAGPAGQPEVRDSAGLAIVENGGLDVPFGVVPVHVADLIPPDSALTAVPWGVAVDPAAGRIYLADAMGARVAVFDVSGAWIGDLGREGDGPGEFRSASAVFLDADGVLTVWDARRSVLSRWSPAGEHLGEEPAPIGYWGPGFALVAGDIVTVTADQDPPRGMIQRLVAVSAGGARTLHAAALEMGEIRMGGSSLPAPRVLAPSVVWAARGGRLYVLRGPAYRVDVLEGGAPVASVRRAVAPIPVTRDMALESVASGPGPYARFMRRAGLSAEQILDMVGHVPEVSPVQAIAVDDAGRIWVSRTLNGITPALVDVLGADGSYLGTIESAGVPVGFVSDSLFLSLRLDAMGQSTVSLHRLRPSAGNARASLSTGPSASVDRS
ncbi:MAG TPA: 6-bladed beta-propeller [Longimicrobiales bacterium]|nr:6-bladed beta-propeller [Longimicrobiales bacterium]